MEKIIIIGGKGSSVATAELIDSAHHQYNSAYEFIGFCIDDLSLGNEINGYPILCNRQQLMEKYAKYQDVKFIFSLYKPDCMEKRTELLKSMDIPLNKFTNFIHPTAYVAKSANIGLGNVISYNVVINNNTCIGNHNALYSHVVIEHDTIIGNSNFFAATSVIGSEITIGNGNFFGLNSSAIEHISIGDYNIIGMGAVAIHNIGNNKKVVGVPAREI